MVSCSGLTRSHQCGICLFFLCLCRISQYILASYHNKSQLNQQLYLYPLIAGSSPMQPCVRDKALNKCSDPALRYSSPSLLSSCFPPDLTASKCCLPHLYASLPAKPVSRPCSPKHKHKINMAVCVPYVPVPH